MAGRLAGKTAFLTAAAAGIGRATAIAYAREGARVIATDVDVAGLEALKQEQPQIETARLDVLSPAQCDAIGTRWPDINILVNVAGFVHHGTILDCPPEEWTRSFDLNVNSMYRTIRSVLPRMIERGDGSIVNVSSIASSIKGIPNRCVYGATKAAVIGLTKSIAADFVGKGHPLQRHLPGHRRFPVAGRAHGGVRRSRGCAAGLHGTAADAATGKARGSRGARRLSRQRRICVYHRHHTHHRRWLDYVNH